MSDDLNPVVKNVLIAVPSYDGRLPIMFSDAIIQSMLSRELNGYTINPAYIIGDANLARARNELFALAYTMGMDELVFIDADIIWTAESLACLLKAPADVVGGSYPIKVDSAIAVVKFTGKLAVDPDTHLAEVDALGAGFLRISRRAMKKIWETSLRHAGLDGKIFANVFEFTFSLAEGHIPEDIGFCRKWRSLGEKVYLHTLADVSHVGTKVFKRPVLEYLNHSGFLASPGNTLDEIFAKEEREGR